MDAGCAFFFFPPPTGSFIPALRGTKLEAFCDSPFRLGLARKSRYRAFGMGSGAVDEGAGAAPDDGAGAGAALGVGGGISAGGGFGGVFGGGFFGLDFTLNFFGSKVTAYPPLNGTGPRTT